jgi:hypothetical protein
MLVRVELPFASPISSRCEPHVAVNILQRILRLCVSRPNGAKITQLERLFEQTINSPATRRNIGKFIGYTFVKSYFGER